MRYLGDYKEDETINFVWSTNDGDGAAINPTTAGDIKVYKDNNSTAASAPDGVTDTRPFASTTGLQHCKIDLSISSFYSKGSDYSIVLVGAVIDTQTVNAVIATFSIEKRYQGLGFEKDG